MKKFFSMLAAATILAGASAKADSIVITTAGAISASGATGVAIGDKVFNNFVYSGINATDRVAIEEHGQIYSLAVGDLGDNPVSGITFDYNISVTNPNNVITAAALDSTVNPFFATNITKQFSNGVTLVSTTGSTGSQHFAGVSTLHVHVTTSGVAGSNIVSILDTYQQSPRAVPEPSTFALLGLGGIGFMIRAVRRRRAAV